MRLLLSSLLSTLLFLLPTALFAEDGAAATEEGGGDGEPPEEGGDESGSPEAPWQQPAPPAAEPPPPKDDGSWALDIGRLKGGGPVGLGFVVGSNNGFSLKIWPAQMHGIVLHVGVPGLLNSVGFGLSYRIHVKPIVIPQSPVALHVQLGPAFRTRLVFRPDTVWTELGGGAVVGMSVAVRDVPAELFFEVAPTVAGAVNPAGQGIGFDVEGLVGARFYPGR